MRTMRWPFLLGLALCIMGCGSRSNKSKDLIIGKWQGTAGLWEGNTVEFTRDGFIHVSGRSREGDLALMKQGKYEIVDGDHLEIELDDKSFKDRLKVQSISKDELSLRDGKGNDTKLRRTK